MVTFVEACAHWIEPWNPLLELLFSQTHKIDNIGIIGFTIWNKIFQQQNVTSSEEWTWDL